MFKKEAGVRTNFVQSPRMTAQKKTTCERPNNLLPHSVKFTNATMATAPTTFEVRPLAGPLGAEVLGADLTRKQTLEEVARIQKVRINATYFYKFCFARARICFVCLRGWWVTERPCLQAYNDHLVLIIRGVPDNLTVPQATRPPLFSSARSSADPNPSRPSRS